MAQATQADSTHPGPVPTSGAGIANNPRRWWALAATNFGLFMALLDVTIVNVALPTIGKDLNASFADLQWVVNAYGLALAVFLVTAGRLGDLFGRKRLFIIGLGVFSLGSLCAALAGNVSIDGLSHIQVLLAARVLQGIGGSIMLPLSLAIIAATFQGRERSLAIGIYGGVIGLATALGPVIGGLLVEKVNWQSIFYLNVPIGVVGIALCLWAITESVDSSAPRSVDFYGLLTLSVSLFCLVLALIQGSDPDKGWTSPYILTLFGISAVALVAFIIGELRLKYPMVDPRLFKNISFTGASIVAFTLSAGMFSLFFFLSLYLQNYLGFSALDAGMRFLPLSGLILVAGPLAGIFGDRLGPKAIMGVGMALLVLAVLLMARISPTDTQTDWLVLLAPFILGGLGAGMVSPQVSAVAVGTVSRNRAGMASGINGVCRQIGTAFGIALLGAILTNQYNASLQTNISQLTVPGVPSASQQGVLNQIIATLQNAGTFVGSTGLKDLPPQYASFARQPLFPQIQSIVQNAFINSTVDIFYVAVGLLVIGLIAALVLIRKSDMLPAEPGSKSVAVEV
ncbi:MAG TPA: MFS transporter [Ktedonobacterales bacterium]|nr:MFS transporter [Ktedonobacterales bacterium]